MELFELPDLSLGAPAKVAIARVTQIDVGYTVNAARTIAPSGHFKGHYYVLNEAVVVGGSKGLLVQTHGGGVSPLELGDLGRHQGRLVAEGRWIVVCPFAQLFAVHGQKLAPTCLLVRGRILIERGHRQRGVVKVVEQLDLVE